MKKLLFLWLAIQATIWNVRGQTKDNNFKNVSVISRAATATINSSNIITYNVAQDKTTHIISPEPILYVDISSPDIEGDLPTKTLFRFKPNKDCAEGKEFQVTVVTEQYVMAYKMILTQNSDHEATVITINPNEAVATNSYNNIGKAEFNRLSLRAMSNKPTISNIKEKENGIELMVNNIYTVGDFLLFDIGVKNKTNLAYNIDQLRFKLIDKKKVASHSSQEIELNPVYQMYKNDGATVIDKWRNFYMFKKFTYPGEKVFNIELAEKEMSGRQLNVKINYKRILEAEPLN